MVVPRMVWTLCHTSGREVRPVVEVSGSVGYSGEDGGGGWSGCDGGVGLLRCRKRVLAPPATLTTLQGQGITVKDRLHLTQVLGQHRLPITTNTPQ